MRTIQPKSNGKEIPGQKFMKTWVYLASLTSFPEITESAVSIATGNFRKWKLIFGRMEGVQQIYASE